MSISVLSHACSLEALDSTIILSPPTNIFFPRSLFSMNCFITSVSHDQILAARLLIFLAEAIELRVSSVRTLEIWNESLLLLNRIISRIRVLSNHWMKTVIPRWFQTFLNLKYLLQQFSKQMFKCHKFLIWNC